MSGAVGAPILAEISAETIVFVFGAAILLFVFVLSLKAVGSDEANKKFIFSVIALLLGLFGGGGIGALVGGQSANNAATSAASSAANSVKSQVTTAAENAANKAVEKGSSTATTTTEAPK
jgi:hypothetical protein